MGCSGTNPEEPKKCSKGLSRGVSANQCPHSPEPQVPFEPDLIYTWKIVDYDLIIVFAMSQPTHGWHAVIRNGGTLLGGNSCEYHSSLTWFFWSDLSRLLVKGSPGGRSSMPRKGHSIRSGFRMGTKKCGGRNPRIENSVMKPENSRLPQV